MELFFAEIWPRVYSDPQCHPLLRKARVQPDPGKIRAGEGRVHPVCGAHLARKRHAGSGGGIPQGQDREKACTGRPAG